MGLQWCVRWRQGQAKVEAVVSSRDDDHAGSDRGVMLPWSGLELSPEELRSSGKGRRWESTASLEARLLGLD